jgi:predicted Zn-dependent peptidase
MALAMAMILETSPSFSLSGMDQSLRVERGLVYAIDAGNAWIETASPHVQVRINDPVRRDYGAVKMQLAPVNALYAAKIVIKELADLDAAGIGEADIARIQQLLARADSSSTDAVERMKARLAQRWMGLDTGMRGSKSGGTALTSVRVRQLLRSAFDPANLWIVAVVPAGERLRAEILSGMTAYVYPDWVDRREIRRMDQEYLSYRPFWQADKIQVLKADSLFR